MMYQTAGLLDRLGPKLDLGGPMQFTIGTVTVTMPATWTEIQGKSMDRENTDTQMGQAAIATATTLDGLILQFALCEWADGSKDMRTLAKIQGPSSYDRLVSAGRMAIESFGEAQLSGRVRAMKINAEKRQYATLADVSWPDLSSLLELDARNLVSDLGPVKFGTAEQLLGSTNRNRLQEAVLVDRSNLAPLYAVWVITRIIAVMKNFGDEGVEVMQ